MKIFFASDVHGSAKWCKEMLNAFGREGADRLVLLGDILYHGPRNPLPDEYSPKTVAELLAPYAKVITCVRGNCESEVDQMVLNFNVSADYGVIMVDGLNIHLSHGHRAVPPVAKGDVYVTGHTHVPLNAEEDGFFHLNPGSVSLPKENSAHGYIIYENREFIFKTLEGREYDRRKV
ncbi:MAG: phosphodiesterase [Candidatus Coproplasma sp.]